MDCIFCRIIAREVPSNLIYEDKDVVAFPDINPVAPKHILIVPKKHIATLADVTKADLPLMGHLIEVANQLARKEGIADSGYRVVINCGRGGGQGVFHLHMHLLGGRQLSPALG